MPTRRTTRSPGSTGRTPTATLVDFVAALHDFRKAHPALTHDHFLTGQTKHGIRDVAWLHPDGREMNEGDWSDARRVGARHASATPGDEVLVWFNRRIDAGRWRSCRRATGRSGSSPTTRPTSRFGGGAVTLPARSVVALVRGADPAVAAQEPPTVADAAGSAAA